MSHAGLNWFVLWEESLSLLSGGKRASVFLPPCSTASTQISTFPVFLLKNRPHPHHSPHENPSFINTSIFRQRDYLSLSPLFSHPESLFLLFSFLTQTLPCSILSSLAPCETPTQGLREMNGLILKGKERSITWCAHTCAMIHTYADMMNSFWGTVRVHMLKCILASAHAHRQTRLR